jgi:peptidoglycan/xylan/chitin deacetylase (PgdA/CDA1 family)
MNNLKNRISFLVIGLLLTAGSVLIAASFENNSPPDLMKDYEILRTRIKQNPNDVAALNSLGIIYAKSGQLRDAIKIWKYALRIDRQYIHLYNNLGSALKEAGRKSEARIIFQTGLTVANSYWIHYNLGLLEKEEGNIVAAVNCFKKTLQLNPTFQSAINRLAELGHNVQPAPMNRIAKPLSLGSYKPPVGVGNIDLYPLYPDGRYAGNARQPTYKSVYGKSGKNHIEQPFSPLTLASCTEIIKNFKALDKDKYIALTFDDGPHGTHTPQILDILKKNAAKATFFLVGTRAEAYPDIVSRISSEGHALGNHTWSHKSLAKSDKLKALNSLKRTNELINGLTGKTCNIVRPPYGHTSQKVKKLLHDQGWHEVMWDSDSRDWENKDSDRILYRVMKNIAPGSIVLFHDIHPGAAGMLPTLISAFKANGYRFITIPELIKLASGNS